MGKLAGLENGRKAESQTANTVLQMYKVFRQVHPMDEPPTKLVPKTTLELDVFGNILDDNTHTRLGAVVPEPIAFQYPAPKATDCPSSLSRPPSTILLYAVEHGSYPTKSLRL